MSLEKELQTERVSHLDLSGFCTVESGTAVSDTLIQMRAEKQNVCLITENSNLIGILTDRDVLRKITTNTATWDQPVDQIMTRNPITVLPETAAAEALWLMDEKHFRNLPVVKNDGSIVGTMTHQSIVSYLAARYPIEVLNQPPLPNQFINEPDGG